MNKILNKILTSKRRKWEFPVALLAFFLGLLILLLALQFNFDMNHIFNRQLRREKQPDYLIINKHLGQEQLMIFEEPEFSEAEISEIESLDWVNDWAKVISNNFPVRAEFALFGQGFVTELFFEAVPDDFLDIFPEDWSWKEGDVRIPIVISRDFLVLYNFGFAGGRQFPYISEAMLASIPINLRIQDSSGKGIDFEASIVGLSDRIASILLPYDFLRYANKRWGGGDPPATRLILSVDDRTNPQVGSFLQQHRYETNKDKLRLSEAGNIIEIVLSALSGFGIVLLILSFTIIFLTYRMLLVQNKEEISQLVHLGFYPKEIIFTILKPILAGMVLVLVFSTAAFLSISVVVHRIFLGFGVQSLVLNLPVIIIAVIISALLVLFQYFLLHRLIAAIAKKEI
ncbi:MAG: hypothetical protein JXR70_04380 [Spirochaetales bacterium]|nr:hypothetical protein [Spirochaetales bacterium]